MPVAAVAWPRPIDFLPNTSGRGSWKMVFRLLKLAFSLGALAAFTWFGLTVPLGERTFFQHVAAIFRSPESQELIRGTSDKVGELSRMIRGGEGGAGAGAPAAEKPKIEAQPGAAPPAERLSAADRREMRRLLDTTGKPAAR